MLVEGFPGLQRLLILPCFHLIALKIIFNFLWNDQLKIDLNIISLLILISLPSVLNLHSTAKDAILPCRCQQLVVVA